ncbi:MAG: PQQ-binding-like beta-propeller repeat protein [candidate division WOR-3 bacterium]
MKPVGLMVLFYTQLMAAVWTFMPDESLFPRIDEIEMQNVYLPAEGEIRLSSAVEPLTQLEDAVIWSIAPDRSGNLYIGTGNQSRLYRFNLQRRQLVPVFSGEEGQILAVLVQDNQVYFGTSPQGIVWRLLPDGKSDTFVNTGEVYIHSLISGPGRAILCATGPNGRLYLIGPEGRTKTVFTAPSAHITTLSWLRPGEELLAGTAPAGTLYRLRLAPDGSLTSAAVLYDTPLEEVRAVTVRGRQIYLAANPGTESQSGGQPTVYALNSEGLVRWQWQCPESTIFSLVSFGDRLLVFTGNRGLIYALDTLGRAGVLARMEEPQLLVTAVRDRELYFGTGNPAAVYRLTSSYADSGYFTSPVYDCQTVARFGRMVPRLHTPAGTEVGFETRSGNAEEPDSLWSSWMPVRERVVSPPARFIQWRAKFATSYRAATPALERVDLYYQPVNRAPVINRLDISTPVENEVRRGNAQPRRQITFDVSDPDGDSLLYQLLLRPEGGADWLVLKGELTESRYELDTRALPDGWYRIKVIVSDAPDHGADEAQTAERESPPFLIDNTPPVISEIRISGNRAQWTVTDATSPLAACRIAVNSGSWVPVVPEDTIFDGLSERFSSAVELKPGLNTVAVWAVDGQGNVAVRQLTVNR